MLYLTKEPLGEWLRKNEVGQSHTLRLFVDV
jgi:hypothetical protein